jgi:23S rRNA (uracil1939-C5)-methyltransferase
VAAFHVPAGSALAASPTLRRLADPLVREGALAGWAAIDADGRILDAAGEIQLAHVFPEGSVPGAPYTLRQRGWAFAQPSFEANLALVRAAVAALGEPFPASVLELYAGSGNFTLPLAARCEQVTAVEGDPDAARELSDNLEANGRRARVIAADVARAAATIGHAHAVLLDPPRAGADAVVPEILRLEPERIVYVSCHPATLARDLAALAAGGYRVESVQALDLFPQTYHVETVATCVREDA